MSNVSENFANMSATERVEVLDMFDEYALAAMTTGGYWNDFTGELMTATRAEIEAVEAMRTERRAHWEAEYLANEIAGEVSPVVSDTVSVPLYSLTVNGKKSAHATFVTRWGIAYGVARELSANGYSADSNAAQIAAVLATLDSNDSVILGDLEFSTIFEANN